MRKGLTTGPRTSPPPETAFDTHDHEWVPAEEGPYIEDGAAIFCEECRYAETKSVDMGRHGTEEVVVGAECEETRSFRFELAEVTKTRDGEPDITYIGRDINNFEHIIEGILIDIEVKGDIVSLDPDRDCGSVTVERNGWKAVYKAGYNPDKDS